MSDILIKNLDDSYQIVLYTTGVGALAQAHFTLHAGSSKFALESGCFYAMGSLQLLLGHTIEKYVCQEVAEDMAICALVRGHEIMRVEGNFQKQVVGIGMTGAVRTTRPKTGRHHAFFCIHFGDRKYDYYIDLTKDVRTREEEDQFISQLIFETTLQHIQKQPSIQRQIENGSIQLINQSHSMIANFVQMLSQNNKIHSILLHQNNYQINPLIQEGVVLSGSFNPIHQGHLDLAKQAALAAGLKDFYFELTVVNADKGVIQEEEVQKRVSLMMQNNVNIILSNKPFYYEKNVFLQNGAFAVGVDTYERIINPKYYNNSEKERDMALYKLVVQQNKFIVAPRLNEATQKLEKVSDFEMPKVLQGLVLELGDFRNDISSTKLRK